MKSSKGPNPKLEGIVTVGAPARAGTIEASATFLTLFQNFDFFISFLFILG